jgi:ABC-type phosphate/phosphonate transport system permease subunit
MKDDENIASLIKQAGFDKPRQDLSNSIMNRIWLEPTYNKLPYQIGKKTWVALSLAMAIMLLFSFFFGNIESSYILNNFSNLDFTFFAGLFERHISTLSIIAACMVGLLILLLIDRFLRSSH